MMNKIEQIIYVLYIMSVVPGWADPNRKEDEIKEVKDFIKKCENEELKEKFKLYIKVKSLLYDYDGKGIGDGYAYNDAARIIEVNNYNEELILRVVNNKLKHSVKQLQDVDEYSYMSNKEENKLLSKRKKKAIKYETYISEINIKYPAPAPVQAHTPTPRPTPAPAPISNKQLYSSFFKSTPEPQSKKRIPDSDDEFEDASGGGNSYLRKTSKRGFIKKRKSKKTIKNKK